MYHKVGPRPKGALVPHHYVSEARLGRHCRALSLLGFSAMTVSGLLDRWDQEGEQGRFACLTFDDGYLNFEQRAVPVLRACNCPATVFAVSDLLGQDNAWDTRNGDVSEPLMPPDGLMQVATLGFEIGSHTCSHARLTEVGDAELADELERSRRHLSSILGTDVPIFCYPYGAQDDRVRRAVAKAGYRAACSVEKGWNDPGTDRFRLKRINVRSDTSTPVLFWKLWSQNRRDTVLG